MSTGRVALVTGGSSGIGAAVCRSLAEKGARVLVAARRTAACVALAAEIEDSGGVARPLKLDVTDPDSVQAAARKAEELLGPVDWLVNAAGIAESGPLVPKAGSQDPYERHLAVNFHGPRRMLEALLDGMRERGYGRVVQVASSAGLRGYPYVAAYCASKFALVGYTLAAALELEGSGVTVNAVCPHYVDTPMLEASVRRLVEKTYRSVADARAFFRAQNPGGELVTTDEVAGATLALLEDDVTGHLVELDGSGTPIVHAPRA